MSPNSKQHSLDPELVVWVYYKKKRKRNDINITGSAHAYLL